MALGQAPGNNSAPVSVSIPSSHSGNMYVNGANISYTTNSQHVQTNPGINFSFNSNVAGNVSSRSHANNSSTATGTGMVPSVSYANSVQASNPYHHSHAHSHTNPHQHYSIPPTNIVQSSHGAGLNIYPNGNAAHQGIHAQNQHHVHHQATSKKASRIETGAPIPTALQKSSYNSGGPYGGAKRGAGTRKRKRTAPVTRGGARAVRVPADRDFAVGLDDPLCETLRPGGRALSSLEFQKLKDATSLLQEMQLHILEPLTLYTPVELYELMASIAETWKNSGKAAWKKRINKIKENARGRKAPRNQLDPAEINEINQLNERIRIRENWEKNEKEKIELRKRLEKRAQQRSGKDIKAKAIKKTVKKAKRLSAAINEKNIQKSQQLTKAKSQVVEKGKLAKNNNSKEKIKSDKFVPGVADIASVLAIGATKSK
eukprot:CAMPEP_0204836076 /NCGR_PEP_ID=MMETSP1346-20131115/24236_1 /ASSEMBLY_ACC=CAM_ASM_000771 /TAXON_ID=215587 /ORGANISM="Aplanochytrium stocchinoi, Strain GSBS06" /LENGTH=429 /DNA_ID=CAMNT_0051970543 /DNA_START=389 /DNA_END=1678 /DNA_ORIENTATION=-